MSADISACTGFLGFGHDEGGTYSLTCNAREHCRRYQIGKALVSSHSMQSWTEPAITEVGCELFLEATP
ncbi:MAG: hypothetical protein EPN60_16965 [Nevskiaceae bacterium]|nr:MAG: hypothetical protein EPN60_16965 [Nevskiaceae bacterium]